MDTPLPLKNWREYVGRFSVEFDVANHRDLIAAELCALPPEQVRRTRVSGVVDTGATRLVLPGHVVQRLGLPEKGRVTVRFADNRREERDIVSEAYVQIGDRTGVFSAVVEPGRTDALIGAIVLEELDLVPDCTAQKLVPRDPNGLFAEID